MNILGFDFTLSKRDKALSAPVASRGGWFPIIAESFAGAWQTNTTVNHNSVLAYHAVFSCMTLIARDIAKLRVKVVEKDADGIWIEVTNPAYSPVLRKPNTFQTRIQFFEAWVLSKLMRGNTYVLKIRDNRNVVSKMYVLDPNLVRPLISDQGDVFYELDKDNMSGIEGKIRVPASEIIHDRMNCLFHPLVGVSPIYANGLAATQGLRIQDNSTSFFGNKSMPGGILSAPGSISDETAARLKATWDTNYSGANAGKIAVVGDDLKFHPIAMSASDAQLIEQLKWTAEIVCSTFHVPPYKIGVGQMPAYNNIQALNVEYYSQALQSLIEDLEICLDEGLAMAPTIGTEFDLDGLLRMDAKTQIETLEKGVKAGIMAPNEARKKLELKRVNGGDSPMIQQQNYSLEALAERDSDKPFSKPTPAPLALPAPELEPEEDQTERVIAELARRSAERLVYAQH